MGKVQITVTGVPVTVLPFSTEAILSAPHPSPLSRLENFIRSNLPEDISATENAEGGNDPAVI